MNKKLTKQELDHFRIQYPFLNSFPMMFGGLSTIAALKTDMNILNQKPHSHERIGDSHGLKGVDYHICFKNYRIGSVEADFEFVFEPDATKNQRLSGVSIKEYLQRLTFSMSDFEMETFFKKLYIAKFDYAYEIIDCHLTPILNIIIYEPNDEIIANLITEIKDYSDLASWKSDD